jgi:flagellar protein FliO/FliZ
MPDPTLFAAPAAASHGTAGGGAVEVTLALLLVVGIIAFLAWLTRRMRRFGTGAQDRIQVLSDRSVGPKERCVLVRVGETDILVGVSPGSVRALHVFAPGANTAAPPAPAAKPAGSPNFKDMLLRSLGK